MGETKNTNKKPNTKKKKRKTKKKIRDVVCVKCIYHPTKIHLRNVNAGKVNEKEKGEEEEIQLQSKAKTKAKSKTKRKPKTKISSLIDSIGGIDTTDKLDETNRERIESPDIMDRDEAPLVVRCKYLLACDGAHSTIRKQLGINFEGERLEGVFSMADVNLVTCSKSSRSEKEEETEKEIKEQQEKKEEKDTETEEETETEKEKKKEEETETETEKEKEEQKEEQKEGKDQQKEQQKTHPQKMKPKQLLTHPYRQSPHESRFEMFVGVEGIATFFHMPTSGFSRIIIPNLPGINMDTDTCNTYNNNNKNNNNKDSKERNLYIPDSNIYEREEEKEQRQQEEEEEEEGKKEGDLRKDHHPTIVRALSEDKEKQIYHGISSFLKQHDNKFLSQQVKLTQPRWITQFKVSERLAS